MATLNINLNIDEDLKNKILIKFNNINIDDYILDFLQKEVDEGIFLGRGFYFDINNQKLFKKNNQIHLTKKELELMRILLENKNKIVEIDKIKLGIWKKEDVSRFTIRNFIKSLRNKTYPELIINKSNIGYIIVTD